MKVSFRKKYLDLVACNFHYLYHSPIFYGLLIFVIGIGIKPNWQAANSVAEDKSLLYRLVLFAILNLVPVIFTYAFTGLILLLASISMMNKTVLTDCSMTFDNDSIVTETAYARSEVKWIAVRKLMQTRSHIFFYVKQSGALVVPKRAFSSAEACSQFFTTCQARLKA